LACGDQRRLTGNGSALEVVLHDYALYKSTFTYFYFTLDPFGLNSFSGFAAFLHSYVTQETCFPAICHHVREIKSPPLHCTAAIFKRLTLR